MSSPTIGKLASLIKTGVAREPMRVLLYGPEGIGKTTWAANAPNAIFVGTEGGQGDLDIDRMPAIDTWDDIGAAIKMLIEEPHDYQTLVIDTIDHLERKVWDHIGGGKSIEDVGGGYGKGYIFALEQFQRLASLLDDLRDRRGMNVILLGHAVLEKVSNPEGPDYEKFTLKMHKKAAGFWKEWSDVLLFAHMDVRVVSNDKGDKALLKKGKAVGGDRVIETTAAIAYDAKNRYSMPETLPMEWAPFARAARFDIDHRKPPGKGAARPAAKPAEAESQPARQAPKDARTIDELRDAAHKALSDAGIVGLFHLKCPRVRGEWSRTDITNAGATLRYFTNRGETEQALDRRRSLTIERAIAANIPIGALIEDYGDADSWSHEKLTKMGEKIAVAARALIRTECEAAGIGAAMEEKHGPPGAWTFENMDDVRVVLEGAASPAEPLTVAAK